jgi:hypothetical protein
MWRETRNRLRSSADIESPSLATHSDLIDTEVSDAAEALALVRRHRSDLLLLHWGLNAEQGQEHPGPLVPYTLVALSIIFVSGIVLTVRRRRRVEPLDRH